MAKHTLRNEYFRWMYRLVCSDRYPNSPSYFCLLSLLDSIEFTYSIPLDENRAWDGADLRYRFGRERGLDDNLIELLLDDRPCSVLEMLVALSIRCEEHIMYNPEIGDRTCHWFWIMLSSLGLKQMDDTRFDDGYSRFIIVRFLNHQYRYDGAGGLFTIPNCSSDMTTIEIWRQLMLYLNYIMDNKIGG